MENVDVYANSATELLEIFKYLEKSIYDKIPMSIKENLKSISNNEYKFEIDKTKVLKDQKILPETKQLLSVIFVKYCVNKEEANDIIEKWKKNDLKLEEIKRNTYDSNKIFENSTTIQNMPNIQNTPNDSKVDALIVNEKISLYDRIINKIKEFFKAFFK